MNITEMIKQLEELREKHGDLLIVFRAISYEDEPCYSIVSSWDVTYEPSVSYRIARGIYNRDQAIVIE